MQRMIRLLVAFDGTDFHGWQYQPGRRTVQGVLEDAIRRVVRHPTSLRGSGRTDSGVHAVGHVSSFPTDCPLDTSRLKHALGSRLDTDVAILSVREVHPNFDATRSAHSKLYRYRIHGVPQRPVDRHVQRYTYHCWRRLDLGRMQAAAQRFVGERDFSSMAGSGCVRASMVRRILRCDVERHLSELRIDVEGTGFLYKQVRTMAGTLVDVGRGALDPDDVTAILDSCDRTRAGPTLPGHGLCLRWVRYPAHLLRAPAAEPDDTHQASGL